MPPRPAPPLRFQDCPFPKSIDLHARYFERHSRTLTRDTLDFNTPGLKRAILCSTLPNSAIANLARISHFARESYFEPTTRDCNGNFEQGLSPKRKKTDSIDGMDANGIRSTLVSCAYSHLRVTRTNLGAISM